jgi:hypothetical protein
MSDQGTGGAARPAINVVWCPDCRAVIAAGRTTGGSHRHADGSVHRGLVVEGVADPAPGRMDDPKALAKWMKGLAKHVPAV